MKYNYLKNLNALKKASKFDMIYEAVIKDLDIYKNITPAKNINDVSLNLILEEIEKPQYIVCESSGKSILLEEAIFMDEDYLIYEGILEKVGEKIQQIIDWIKQGIKKVLSKASDIIKTFCEKVKNNKVVAAIRKKLGLDEKLKEEKFKKFVKLSYNGKNVAVESILNSIDDKNIISEATKLNKKEEAITNPKELEPIIQKWEDVLAGKRVINNVKTGKPLSKKYCKDKLRLLKRKYASLQEINKNTSNKEIADQNVDKTQTAQTAKENKKESVGDLHFDIESISNVIISIKDESLSDESIKNATKDSAIAVGGEDAKKVISGDTPPADDSKPTDSTKPEEENKEETKPTDSTKPEEEKKEETKPEEEKKKGFFGRLGDKVNKAGNKLKEKIQSGLSAAKKWFNSQNKFVKILICCIIAILAILAIYFLITGIIYPILYNIFTGGIINAAIGIFRIYASGKVFVATYKQGQKSWKTGEGWGKTFLLIGSSILASVNLGQMAIQGSEMMAADEASEINSSSSSSSSDLNDTGSEAIGFSIGDTLTAKDGTVWTVNNLGDSGYPKVIDAVEISTMLPDGTTVTNYMHWSEILKGQGRVNQMIEAFTSSKDLEF